MRITILRQGCRRVLWGILVLQAFAAWGQSAQDSLWAIWRDPTRADTERIAAIEALTRRMLHVDFDSAYTLAQAQLNLARSMRSDAWIGTALFNIAVYYHHKGDLDRAIAYYRHSLPYRERMQDQAGIASIHADIGNILSEQGHYMEALSSMKRALAIRETLRDTAGMARTYNLMAILHFHLEDSAAMMAYYAKSLATYDPVRNKADISDLYNNIGMFYRQRGDYPRALDYLNRSLAIRKELNDNIGLAINLVNLGSIYNAMGNYAVARRHTMESLRLFEALKDDGRVANCYSILGQISINEGKYREAVDWCRRALRITEANGKVSEQMKNCRCLYRAYKGLGAAERALYFHERSVMLDDSLNKEDTRQLIQRREFEQRILADSLARAEENARVQLAFERQMRQKGVTTTWILAGGSIVLLLALMFLSGMVFFQRNAQRLGARTRELEKQQLINEISLLRTQVNPHFLFNSLSILSSLVRVDTELSEKFIDQLSKSYRYILEQSDQATVTLRTELGFIESYAYLLRIRFENKFDLDIRIPEEYLDTYRIAPLTLQLLIENAVKHNRMSVQEPLRIRIRVDADNTLVVSNTLQRRPMAAASTGVGLRNIRSRYALLTRQPFWAGEADGAFVVKIPLLLPSGDDTPPAAA